MFLYQKIKIRKSEKGFLFVDGEFEKLLAPGTHTFYRSNHNITISSQRTPWLVHTEIDAIIESGVLKGEAEIVDLKTHERALVWIDGRFDRVLEPGQYVYWKEFRDVKIELYDSRDVWFEHTDLNMLIASGKMQKLLTKVSIDRDHVGVLFQNGKLKKTLEPGTYAYWTDSEKIRIFDIDLREQILDVSGQEIMTSDKVTLRMNLILTYRVVDAVKSVRSTDDSTQALYRETQLALRAIVGARELDTFLGDKNVIAEEIQGLLHNRAGELGLQVISAGVRDIILPGDMKDLMNRVIEAKKVAEANLVARREETAAMRSQSNTAKLLTDNPTLMRLRELEVLEKIATAGNLNVILSEKGLADRVTNLL